MSSTSIGSRVPPRAPRTSAIRARHPEVHFEVLDALLGHEAPGQLEELLAPKVRSECTPEDKRGRDA